MPGIYNNNSAFSVDDESINNQAKTLLDLAKTEVEMLKVQAYMGK